MHSNMNNPREPQTDRDEVDPPQGPNLVVLYSVIALALAVAIALAAWIVLPFYLRR